MRTLGIIVIVLLVVGIFVVSYRKRNSNNENVSVAGKVDLWCENGKYYKRTTTDVYGKIDQVEISRVEFDTLVNSGISYSGCKVGTGGAITA